MNGVSIIIPTYKQKKEYLHCAVKSILNQTCIGKIPIEIVIVEDGDIPPDVSGFIFDKGNINFKVHVRGENGGAACALNDGIRFSNPKFKYFSWLSSDDFFYPEFLETHIFALNNLNCKISYSGYTEIIYDKDDNLKGIAQYKPPIPENITIAQQPRLVDIKEFKDSLIKCLHRRSCQYNGCCFIFEKILFDEVGPFNEQYKFIQDFSQWLRMAHNSNIKNIAIVPQSLMSRREHKGRTQFLYSQEDFIKQKTWELTDMFQKFIVKGNE